MTHAIVPCLVDEKAAAVALGCSVSFLRKDYYGKKTIPAVRVGNRRKYDIEHIRATLAARAAAAGERAGSQE